MATVLRGNAVTLTATVLRESAETLMGIVVRESAVTLTEIVVRESVGTLMETVVRGSAVTLTGTVLRANVGISMEIAVADGMSIGMRRFPFRHLWTGLPWTVTAWSAIRIKKNGINHLCLRMATAERKVARRMSTLP
jgi:hypothetical protein